MWSPEVLAGVAAPLGAGRAGRHLHRRRRGPPRPGGRRVPGREAARLRGQARAAGGAPARRAARRPSRPTPRVAIVGGGHRRRRPGAGLRRPGRAAVRDRGGRRRARAPPATPRRWSCRGWTPATGRSARSTPRPWRAPPTSTTAPSGGDRARRLPTRGRADKDAGRFDRIAQSELFEPGAVARLTPAAVAPAAWRAGRCRRPGLPRRPRGRAGGGAGALAGGGRAVIATVAAIEPRRRRLGGCWTATGARSPAPTSSASPAALEAASACARGRRSRPLRGQVSMAAVAQRPAAVIGAGYAIPDARRPAVRRDPRSRRRRRATFAPRTTSATWLCWPRSCRSCAAGLDAAALSGRAGVRAVTPDFLPLAGPLEAAGAVSFSPASARAASAPRPLLAEHVAALAMGAPSPLPAALDAKSCTPAASPCVAIAVSRVQPRFAGTSPDRSRDSAINRRRRRDFDVQSTIANLSLRLAASAAIVAGSAGAPRRRPALSRPRANHGNQCFLSHATSTASRRRTTTRSISASASNDIYRLGPDERLPGLTFRQGIGLESTPGDPWICSPIQATVVFRDTGIRNTCPVTGIHKLTPAGGRRPAQARPAVKQSWACARAAGADRMVAISPERRAHAQGPPPQQLPLAAHPLAAGGARAGLRDRALSARCDHQPGAAGAGRTSIRWASRR